MSNPQIVDVTLPETKQIHPESDSDASVKDTLTLQRVDKGHTEEEWTMTITGDRIAIQDPARVQRAEFGLTESHARLQLPSFAHSVKYLGVRLDDTALVEFKPPSKAILRQLRCGVWTDSGTAEAAIQKLQGALGLIAAGFLFPVVTNVLFRGSQLSQPEMYVGLGIGLLGGIWAGAMAFTSRRLPLASVLLATVPTVAVMIIGIVAIGATKSAMPGAHSSSVTPRGLGVGDYMIIMGLGSALIALPAAMRAVKRIRRAPQTA